MSGSIIDFDWSGIYVTLNLMHWRPSSSIAIALILGVNTLGLGVIYWRLNKPLHSAAATSLSLEAVRLSTAEIADKLTAVQDQLTRLQSSGNDSSVLGANASPAPNQLSDLLPDIPNSAVSASLSYISITADFLDSVPVYKEQADFSTVIGQLIPGQKYPYFTNANNWYQISLTGGKTGWVKADHVHEIQ